MNTIKDGVESLSLLAKLNLDRVLVAFLVASSLLVASHVATYMAAF